MLAVCVRRRARGASLAELLFAVGLAAILATWAMPSFHNSVLDARRTAGINDLVTLLHLARTASNKRALDVVLCPAVAEQCVQGEGWDHDWLVFVNADEDDQPRRDAGEPVLHVSARAHAPSVEANRTAFIMRPFSRRATNGTFTFCDDRGDFAARAVIVSVTGRPRVSDRRPDGGSLECPDAG